MTGLAASAWACGGDAPVNDAAVIGRLLDEYHERSVPPAHIEVVAGSVHEARISYKLSLTDGSAQLVRAYRAEGAVPVDARGPFTETVLDWLLGRAQTLAVLAAAGYHAPRPVLTRAGELVAVAGPWLAWATTYVPGSVLSRRSISFERSAGRSGDCTVSSRAVGGRESCLAPSRNSGADDARPARRGRGQGAGGVGDDVRDVPADGARRRRGRVHRARDHRAWRRMGAERGAASRCECGHADRLGDERTRPGCARPRQLPDRVPPQLGCAGHGSRSVADIAG